MNWSEAAQKVLSSHRDWGLCSSLLYSFDFTIEPVTLEDAEWAARRWRRGKNLSIADRLCLALSARLGMPALTADKTWADYSNTKLIRWTFAVGGACELSCKVKTTALKIRWSLAKCCRIWKPQAEPHRQARQSVLLGHASSPGSC